MDVVLQVVDLFRHLDKHLAAQVVAHGAWIYAILFVVVFCETGLIVTPFLPGDSLLFAAGAIASSTAHEAPGQGLSMAILVPSLIVAAIIGDAVNFAVGRRFGQALLSREKLPLIKRAHVEQTQAFYAKHGSKTIVLARFVPIVRTFAPFVGGIGNMPYATFALYNVVGAVAWVVICAGAGYFFGAIPVVKNNFELVVLGIIGASVLPIVVEIWRARRSAHAPAPPAA
jgi:membrane-associated protein